MLLASKHDCYKQGECFSCLRQQRLTLPDSQPGVGGVALCGTRSAVAPQSDAAIQQVQYDSPSLTAKS